MNTNDLKLRTIILLKTVNEEIFKTTIDEI